MGARVGPAAEDYYALLGTLVRPDALRRLAAFQRFEAELRAAVLAVAEPAAGAQV
jgi:hypothetical protein